MERNKWILCICVSLSLTEEPGLHHYIIFNKDELMFPVHFFFISIYSLDNGFGSPDCLFVSYSVCIVYIFYIQYVKYVASRCNLCIYYSYKADLLMNKCCWKNVYIEREILCTSTESDVKIKLKWGLGSWKIMTETFKIILSVQAFCTSEYAKLPYTEWQQLAIKVISIVYSDTQCLYRVSCVGLSHHLLLSLGIETGTFWMPRRCSAIEPVASSQMQEGEMKLQATLV